MQWLIHKAVEAFLKHLDFNRYIKDYANREGLSFEENTLQKGFKSILICRFFPTELCNHGKSFVPTAFL